MKRRRRQLFLLLQLLLGRLVETPRLLSFLRSLLFLVGAFKLFSFNIVNPLGATA